MSTHESICMCLAGACLVGMIAILAWAVGVGR